MVFAGSTVPARAWAMARRHACCKVGTWLARFMLLLTLGLTVACAPVYRNHGYAPTDNDLALVEVGRDTRESVAEKVGRPSAQGLLNDVGWFYVQSRWRSFGARAPQEVDRQVVVISFADSGTVANVERFGLEQGRVVPLSRRVTESNIRGIGFLRQLLGNLGAFRAEDVLE
jgi:outer membrane protein assembly factor BamE (lipoprotein component of BamABCDE complex)